MWASATGLFQGRDKTMVLRKSNIKYTGRVEHHKSKANRKSAADLFCFLVGGIGTSYTNVGSKFFVSLGFILPLHFIKRRTYGRARRIKLPVTRRATEALKILTLNPF
jgi:hypothetical protein